MRIFKTARKELFDYNNCIFLNFWPQTERNSAGHASLTIVCEGVSYHVSYWHQRDIAQCEQDKLKIQYTGIAPFWVETLDQDCLIEGYRHAMRDNPKLNAKQILEKISEEKFDQKMLPTQSIKLLSLDVQKMRDAFLNYKKSEHKWAFFSGYLYHAEGAHNCSSIVLFLLYQGGMDSLLSGGYSADLKKASLAIGLWLSPFLVTTFESFFALMLSTGLIGGVVGGAIEGYQAVQPFLNVCRLSKKSSPVKDIGITVCAILIGMLQSLLCQMNWVLARFPLPGNVASLTLPENVLQLAIQAKENERNMISHQHNDSFSENWVIPWY